MQPFKNLIESLEYQANDKNATVAYRFIKRDKEKEILTYGQLLKNVQAVSEALNDARASSRTVILLFQPGLDFINAYLGCLHAGKIAVPCFIPQNKSEIARLRSIIENSGSRIILTTRDILLPLRANLSEGLAGIDLEWKEINSMLAGSASRTDRKNMDAVAFLQYTSGSTGSPKGVVVSHENIMHNIGLINQHFGHTTESKGVIWLPAYHDMGLIGGILAPLVAGFETTFLSPIEFIQSPISWLKAISKYGATTSGGPNFSYEFCVRKITEEQMENVDLSSWSVAFNGAEPINEKVLREFASKFERYGFKKSSVFTCYGLAESTLYVSGCKRGHFPSVLTVAAEDLKDDRVKIVDDAGPEEGKRLVSSGFFPGVDLKIVGRASRKTLEDGMIGEIVVNSPSVAKRYWDNALGTQETFESVTLGGLNFMRTGDLGFVKDGELYVTGRIKGAIVIRGKNYYPSDIELTSSMASQWASRGGCAAFSVMHEGEEKLVITQEIRKETPPTVCLKELSRTIKNAVTKEHKIAVHEVVVVAPKQVPKTSSGKVQRIKAKELYVAGRMTAIESYRKPRIKLEKIRYLRAILASVVPAMKIFSKGR